MTLRVKVCGLTRLEDAKLAEACGAHAVGFIFYPPSPRAAHPAAVAEITPQLHPYTVKVGVFVQADPAHINTVAEQCGLDRVQLHGGEPFEMLSALIRPGYRALKLKDEDDVAAAAAAPDPTLMLDTFDPQLHGGTGRPFNWEWARRLGEGRRIILAGGLTAANIGEALHVAQPAAVDVSSALEAEPGRKDAAKVEAFFQALRAALARSAANADSSGSVDHGIAS